MATDSNGLRSESWSWFFNDGSQIGSTITILVRLRTALMLFADDVVLFSTDLNRAWKEMQHSG